jgi:hypothetical protein
VEWLLHWAYVREKVHLARPMGSEPETWSRGPRMGGDSSDKLGAMISSSLNLGFEAHPDAYAVMQAAGAHDEWRLLRDYAMMASRPDWTPRPVIRTVIGKAGHAMHIDKRGKRTLCQFRLFTYRGDMPEIVAERRARYRRWACAVADVHRALSKVGALAAHAVSLDLPKLTPWLDGA